MKKVETNSGPKCLHCLKPITHGIKACNHCGSKDPEILPAIKDAVHNPNFIALGEITHLGNVLTGMGIRIIWGKTVVLYGLLLNLLGWKIALLSGIGVKTMLLGLALVAISYLTNQRKRFTLDYRHKSPQWQSNDDEYWYAVKSQFIPNSRPGHSPFRSATPVYRSIGIFAILTVCIVGYAFFNDPNRPKPLADAKKLIEKKAEEIKAAKELLTQGTSPLTGSQGNPPQATPSGEPIVRQSNAGSTAGAVDSADFQAGLDAINKMNREGERRPAQQNDPKQNEPKKNEDSTSNKNPSAQATALPMNLPSPKPRSQNALAQEQNKKDDSPLSQPLTSVRSIEYAMPTDDVRLIWADKTETGFIPVKESIFEQKLTQRFEWREMPFNSPKTETTTWDIKEGTIFSREGYLQPKTLWPAIVVAGTQIGNIGVVKRLDAKVILPWKTVSNCIEVEESRNPETTSRFFCKNYGPLAVQVKNSNTVKWTVVTGYLLYHLPYPYALSGGQLDYENIKKECSIRNPRACNEAGGFSESFGLIEAAKSYYTQACEFQYGQGCTELGHLLVRLGDPKSAVIYFAQACERGYWDACVYEGAVREAFGDLKALALFDLACEHRDHRGCAAAHRLHTTKNASLKAQNALKTACATGPIYRCEAWVNSSRIPANSGR